MTRSKPRQQHGTPDRINRPSRPRWSRLNIFLEPDLAERVRRVAETLSAAHSGEPYSLPQAARIALRVGLEALEHRAALEPHGVPTIPTEPPAPHERRQTGTRSRS